MLTLMGFHLEKIGKAYEMEFPATRNVFLSQFLVYLYSFGAFLFSDFQFRPMLAYTAILHDFISDYYLILNFVKLTNHSATFNSNIFFTVSLLPFQL